MEAGLKIKIGADIVEVTKSLDRLKSQLKTFEEALAKSTDSKRVDLLNRSIEKTKAIIAGVKDFRIQNNLPQFSKNSAEAAASLSNLSRIAQDAPFGFIGIQNNIDPLLQSFSSLTSQTGGVKNAFKSLAAALSGPAGIALGVSVVTSLITAAIQKYGSLSGALNALTADTSAAGAAQRELGAAFAKAQGDAAGEIATVNSLIGIARNKALSDEARGEAIKKLNDKYKEYLPNLTLENVGTDAVTASVNRLNAALLRQAKIKGIQDLISQETEKQAKAAAAGLDAVANSGNLVNQALNAIRGGGVIGVGLSREVAGLSKEFDEASKRVSVLQQFLNSLLTEEATAGTLFDDSKNKLKGETAERAKATKAIKDQTEALKAQQLIRGEINNAAKFVGTGPFNTSPGVGAKDISGITGNPLSKFSKDAKELKDNIEATAKTITDNLTPAISGVINALGNGQNPFKAFGNAIKQLIIDLTTAAVKAVILKAITNGLTAGAANGSGFSKFLLSAFGPQKGIAGGFNTGGITGTASGLGGGRIVGELRGSTVALALQRTNKSFGI
jgi:hypothetical protein